MFEKILCVDDDPITLMLCKKVIKKSEFSKEVDTALNGEDAIRYFNNLLQNKQDSIPELIFLDLNMPIMNGWEFLDSFSSKIYSDQFKEVKVIILSSTIDPYDIERSKTYSMVVDFMSKPITTEMLEQISI